jgi:hypothetical protein
MQPAKKKGAFHVSSWFTLDSEEDTSIKISNYVFYKTTVISQAVDWSSSRVTWNKMSFGTYTAFVVSPLAERFAFFASQATRRNLLELLGYAARASDIEDGGSMF